MHLMKSRNQREGKYLTVRQYKVGKYGRKKYKKDYQWWKNPCQCEGCSK